MEQDVKWDKQATNSYMRDIIRSRGRLWL